MVAQIFDEGGKAIGSPISTGSPITAVTAYSGPESIILVTGHADAKVRQWDFLTGNQIGEALVWSHRHFPSDSSTYQDDEELGDFMSEWFPVSSVNVYAADTAPVILAGYQDLAPEHDDHDWLWFKTLRRWDAATGDPIPYVGEKDEDDDWPEFKSIAVYRQGSKTRFVAGQDKLRLYDVDTEALVDGFAFDGSEGAVAVTTYTRDGGPIVVAGVANSVGRWNGDSGSSMGPLLSGHATQVTATAVYMQSSGRAVIVSGSMDGVVRQWDAETGASLGEPLVGHSETVTAITSYEAQGRTILVTASETAEVRRWDADSGTAIGTPIKHESSVSALAAFRFVL